MTFSKVSAGKDGISKRGRVVGRAKERSRAARQHVSPLSIHTKQTHGRPFPLPQIQPITEENRQWADKTNLDMSTSTRKGFGQNNLKIAFSAEHRDSDGAGLNCSKYCSLFQHTPSLQFATTSIQPKLSNVTRVPTDKCLSQADKTRTVWAEGLWHHGCHFRNRTSVKEQIPSQGALPCKQRMTKRTIM